MKVKKYVELSAEDINIMPFAVFYEYSVSGSSKTGTQKRKRAEYFTTAELSEFPSLQKEASSIYLQERHNMVMTLKKYKLWLKIGKFLYDNWCIH